MWFSNLQVEIKEKTNKAEELLSWFPRAFADWLSCAYGERYPTDNNTTDTAEEWVYNAARSQPYNTCHLKQFAHYTFKVAVEMQPGQTYLEMVYLEASSWFKNPLLQLRQGDHIRFFGSLQSNLGTTMPSLTLHMLECKTCPDKKSYGQKQLISDAGFQVLEMLQTGVIQVGNFFLAPLVQLVAQNE